jgi:lysyl-tRNA synthetase class 2
MEEKNELISQRIKKLGELREKGIDPFYNKFKVKNNSNEAKEYGKDKTNEELEAEGKEFVLAGRIMAVRNFGKAAFATIKDAKGKFQIFFVKKTLGDDSYDLFKSLDIGDIVGVAGDLFYTKTGLSLKSGTA